jgi:hypothetical protein
MDRVSSWGGLLSQRIREISSPMRQLPQPTLDATLPSTNEIRLAMVNEGVSHLAIPIPLES